MEIGVYSTLISLGVFEDVNDVDDIDYTLNVVIGWIHVMSYPWRQEM